MSQITIIKADSVIGVDGVFRGIDLTDMQSDIHAIQFNTATGAGHIEYDPEAEERKPNKPIGATVFRTFEKYITRWKKAGEPPKRTLEEVKIDARAQINSKRDTLEASGFSYMGKVFDSDSRSVQRISVAVQAAQAAAASEQPFSIDWTAQDNTVITLGIPEMMGMPAALAMSAATLHEHAKAKKVEIENAVSITEVESIAW